MCTHFDNITIASAAANAWAGACSKCVGMINLAGAALPRVWPQLVMRLMKVHVLMQIIEQAQLSVILGCPRLRCTVIGETCALHCTTLQ